MCIESKHVKMQMNDIPAIKMGASTLYAAYIRYAHEPLAISSNLDQSFADFQLNICICWSDFHSEMKPIFSSISSAQVLFTMISSQADHWQDKPLWPKSGPQSRHHIYTSYTSTAFLTPYLCSIILFCMFFSISQRSVI